MPYALDDGTFFHGTVADLRPGELLTAGHPSNYRPEIFMNHIYFTDLVDGAGLAVAEPGAAVLMTTYWGTAAEVLTSPCPTDVTVDAASVDEALTMI